jgi:hypothetical protein
MTVDEVRALPNSRVYVEGWNQDATIIGHRVADDAFKVQLDSGSILWFLAEYLEPGRCRWSRYLKKVGAQ